MVHVKSMYPDVPPVPQANVHHLLFRRPDQQEWKDYTIHIDGLTGEKRTFSQFQKRVGDGATALSGATGPDLTGPNEIVGILGENCMDYFTILQSLLYITVPFTMFSHFYTPFELAHAIRLSKCTRIFVQPKFLPLVQAAAKETGFPADRVYLLDGISAGLKSFGSMIDEVQAKNIPTVDVRPAQKDTLAYLIFSSGTSGLPKAVMISHGNLWFTTVQGAVMGADASKLITPDYSNTLEGIPTAIAFLPLHHAYGLVIFNFRAMLAQHTIIILPKWELDVILRVIPQYKVTTLNLIPSVVHQLVHSPKTKEADLSSLMWLSSGAAYLPEALASKLMKLGPKNVSMTEGYGMSELTLSATGKPIHGQLDGRAKNVPGSAGILLPGMEARVTREDGSLAAPGEPGDLWVKSEGVALGYWENEEATKEAFVDGWLKTGDRFIIDADGVLFFQDRAKDILKISGMQVSPTEIEDTLMVQPDKLITDVAVAGVSGERISDEKVPRAWVVLSEAGKRKGEEAVAKTLDAWIQQTLSKYKRLRGGIGIVSEIPKSPTGKVLRRVLQDEYEQQQKKPTARL